MDEHVDSRLSRIENKLDQLTEAFHQLARLDQQILNQQDNLSRLNAKIDEQEKRIRCLEQTTKVNKQVISNIERFTWILISSGVGLFVWYLQQG